MTFSNIKTVFVDLDDTLWWFSENSKVAMRYVFDEFGLSRFCPYDEFIGIYLTKNQELWDLYHYGKIEKSFLVTERFRYVLEKIGFDGDFAESGSAMNDRYLNCLAQQKLLLPGAKAMLEYLVGKGYDVNVLSNGFKLVQAQKLKSGGIDHLIHKLILSDDCGVTKPLPGIFEYAMRECCADAETTVMIGDNYDADICGAHNAGWHTIFFNMKGVSIEDSVADAEVLNLMEIGERGLL